jgi:hypothetical protein
MYQVHTIACLRVVSRNLDGRPRLVENSRRCSFRYRSIRTIAFRLLLFLKCIQMPVRILGNIFINTVRAVFNIYSLASRIIITFLSYIFWYKKVYDFLKQALNNITDIKYICKHIFKVIVKSIWENYTILFTSKSKLLKPNLFLFQNKLTL